MLEGNLLRRALSVYLNMFNNLTLYYLNQMGITPWIHKESNTSLLKVKSDTLSVPLTLVVITSKLTHKAQFFLNRIIKYLNIPDKELLMITLNEQYAGKNQSLPDFPIGMNLPRAILTLGCHPELLNLLNFECPILTEDAPDYFLDNPSAKRKLFKDLHYIKTRLTRN